MITATPDLPVLNIHVENILKIFEVEVLTLNLIFSEFFIDTELSSTLHLQTIQSL